MAEPRPRRRRAAGQRGHALLSALIATALLLPLGAFAVMQARLDFLVTHHGRAAAETLAVAEAGLVHALADLARAPRFELLLAGPDRRPGTADDGAYPFAEAPPDHFPAPPFRYEVRVVALSSERLEIVARGHGPLGAQRGVAAAVERGPLPYLPAALASDAADIDLLLGAGLRLDGAAGTGGAPDAFALALPDAAAVARLAARLSADEGGRLRGPGGPPSLGVAPLPDLAALLAAAGRRADATSLGAEVGGELGDGLFVAAGAVALRDVRGSGILLVDGPLRVAGTLAFDGLIATTGAIDVDAGATLALRGALLQGGRGGPLLLRGSGQIVYDRRVLEPLAARWPGLLPARARVTGWRELADAAG